MSGVPEGIGFDAPELTIKVRPPGADVPKSPPKLVYWCIRGKGEVPRLILEEAGVAYDNVVVFARSDGRSDYQDVSPNGQLPYYTCEPELGGSVLCQSGAVIRHLAAAHGMDGSECSAEKAAVDMRFESVVDLGSKLKGALEGPADSEAAEKLVAYGRRVEAMFAGCAPAGAAKVTFADLALFSVLRNAEDMRPGRFKALGLDGLDDFRRRVAARPNIARYLASNRALGLTKKEFWYQSLQDFGDDPPYSYAPGFTFDKELLD